MVKKMQYSPRTIIWDFTKHCNMQCSYCYSAESMNDDLTVNEIRTSVLPQLKMAGVKSLCLSGGEPLLRFKDILDIADDVKKTGIDEFLIATNGSLVDDDKIKQLRRAFKGINLFMSVPVDSLDPAIMAELRPPFNDGLDKSLRAIKIGIKNKLIMTVETVVTPKNIDSYPSIIAFVKHLNNYCFAETYQCFGEGRAKETNSLLLDENQSRRLDEMKLLNYGTCLTWDFMPFPLQQNIWDEIKSDARIAQITQGCVIGREYLQLGNDGTIFPCSFLRMPLGNILKDDLMDVWNNNSLLLKIRAREVGGKCGNCPHKEMCGGCRARAYSETGDALGGVQSCQSSVDGHILSRQFSERVLKTFKKQKRLVKLDQIARKLHIR